MTWRSTCNFRKVFIFFITALILSLSSFGQNPVVTENALPGNPSSEWSVPDFRDNRIAGFSTKMSLNIGETVRFKINVQGGANYTLKIYRLGYYGGNGARLKHDFGTLTGTIQPAGISDPATGILDCGNWSQSASWAIPASAVSGLYVAKMERSGGGSNHIVFIVRNDASHSDLYLQFPDARWQAYNGYGGNSTYDGTTSWPSGHAVKASYNRPLFPYNSAFNTDGRGADWYMNNEFAMLRWLERNGYDVTYTGSNHISRNGALLLNHKVFLSIGHDEYWSKGQRDNVEAARNAGIHLAFFSGNEVYWKTRWENNDGSEDRTLVVYKEGLMGDGSQGERACGFKCDVSTSEWTGLWRTGGNYDAGKPENALTGQISWFEYPTSIAVPSNYKKIRFWRNTSVANLATGQTASLGINTLGYEWDYEQPQYASSYPQGRITMSSTTVQGKTHKLSLYRHSSGALVFGAGTIQWSWGLDTEHWGSPQVISPDMQQATINLFADMGVQAGTLQSGLVQTSQSSDFTAPTSTITSPSNGATFSSGATIPITGTATDAGGGVVASVEVSVDGGASWSAATINAADGNVTWSYSWQAGSNGTINIKARGVDDSGNIGNAGAGITVTVGAGGDVTPPTVLSVVPTNGSTGVSVNTTVIANFSEAVNGTTVTGTTFELRDAGNNFVPASVSTSSNQVTLIPSASLTGSTTYTATIKGGASGVKDLSGNALVSDYTWSFTTGAGGGGGGTMTIFEPTSVPANPTNNDGQGIELGVRFRTTQNGFITGVRYYKGAGTTGTHTGTLWSNTGTLLATATFTNETASGWQQVLFSNPVAVIAGVTYVASQYSPSGHYASTLAYFTQAVVNGSLRGLADGEDGINGLYKYSASSTFPTFGNLASNYWVDVVFTTSPGVDMTPPTVMSVSPLSGATGVITNSTVAANFNEAVNSSTVTGTTFQLRAGSTVIPATVSTASNQITLIPTSALANSTTYTATIVGGAAGVKDLAGNALASDYSWSFTTGAGGGGSAMTIFQPTDGPGSPRSNDGQGIALGVKFRSTQNGFVTGVRYYKPAGTTGTHIGQLWSGGGTLLAQATYTNETASGWQQVLFTTPIAITAGITYVASYHSPSGDFAASGAYFTQAVVNGPLRGLANGEDGVNGLYRYTTTPAFPNNGYNASNYWADVVFTTGSGSDVTPPTVSSVSPLNGATGVSINTTITANFSEAVNGATVTGTTFQLKAGSTVIPASVSTVSNQIILTPTSALANSTTYTATIVGGAAGVKDLAGNALVNDFTWTFTTVASVDNTPPTITSVLPLSGATGVSISTVVTANFSEPVNGTTVTGITFELKAGSTVIPATVNTASNQITLTPTAALLTSTTYTVTIKGGATGVKDLAGNALVNDFTWTFTTAANVDNTPPTVTTVSPLNGATGISIATIVTANFSEAINGTTVTGITFELKAGSIVIPATVNTASNQITLTPTAALANSTTYTVTIKGGVTGVKDLAGNALANDFTWTFTTVAGGGGGSTTTIFQPTTVPANPTNNDGQGIVLGVRFRSTQNGFISGIRYYKGAGTTGTHIGSLWSNTGTLLATATFTGETASGWQQVLFSSPVAITAGVTYVASQFSPSGHYASTISYFTQAVVNGALRGLADGEDGINGLYKYSATSAFPTFGHLSSNYWVDVVFTTGSVGTIPFITVQPSVQTVCAGNSVSYTSSANGSPAPTVQWQSSPNGTTWTNITGATNATLTFASTAGDNGKQYRAVWTNSAGTVNSNATTLTVNSIPAAPTVSVANNCGNSVLTASGFTGSLLWSTGETTTAITVTAAGTYTVTQTLNGCTSGTGSGVAAPLNSAVSAPTVNVVNNCGNSVLTASGFTGSLLWSTGATTVSITVQTVGVYTVTQTVNGCASPAGSGTAAPKATPAAPAVSVVDNCANSVLTASGFTGSLLWSNGATTPSITVTTGGTYTVTQTIDGCTSAAGTGVAVPKSIPSAPAVSVANNCGNSVLTASGFTGSLLWSTGETTTAITVTAAGTYTVTQTLNGCTSASGSGIAAPLNSAVAAPAVNVVNNCGSSVLTASGFTGSLLWNTGATTASITVSTGGIYTVTQTVNGCTSPAGGGTAAPKTTPSAPTIAVVDNCASSVLTASGFTGSLLWSNGATTPAITVTTGGSYTVTQTIDGCTSATGTGVAVPKSIPSSPVVSVANNCGSSVLTASAFTGSLLWSNGATTTFITVTTAGNYTVTQTVNGCTSAGGTGTAEPITSVVPTPIVDVVNNCGNSVLTASGFTGSLLWNTGATTASITVSTGGVYAVTQTVNGCTSPAGSGTAAPKTTPAAPSVAVVDNCESSVLTASGFTGSLLWSNTATTPAITVTTGGTYTVTQTIDGCTSAAGTGVAAPKSIPSAPVVSVANNCGSSVLTASGFTGSLLWNTGATTASITVPTGGVYTVTQTVNGCTSAGGTGTAEPITSVVPTPIVDVVNNCGNSVLTASGFTGSLLWSTGATTASITVSTGGVYTVTQTVNGCTSPAGSGTAAPKATPAAPSVAVVDNCESSVLTASGFTGSLLWSNGATTPSITVTTGGSYTVTQTIGGCTSATGTGVAVPKSIPSSPVVSVANNCGSSVLTASAFTGSLLWSTGATTASITVSTGGVYTVTQTVNGCTSAGGTGTAEPITSVVPTPIVDVVNNCGNSVLTASGFTGSLLWSTGATTASITVATGGVYTVTQTVNGCTGPAGSGTAALKPTPALSGSLATTVNSGASFTYVPASTVTNTTFSWSRAAISGISNAAATGTGNITETLVNTTSSPVNVTYVYTLTADGCINSQNVVITVNPVQTVTCLINGSITSSFTNTTIPAGRYIWFNSVMDRNSFTGITGPVTFYVTNSKITFTANSQQYTLTVPDARIRFDATVLSASTQFINNVWETAVPRSYTSYVFMTGLSYQVPSNLPGNISNIKWTADIGIDKTGITVSWKWAAAVYTSFAGHTGLNIKPIGGTLQNPYVNNDKAGAPQNFKTFLVSGAKGTGGTNYTGNYSSTSTVDCTPVSTGQRGLAQQAEHQLNLELINNINGEELPTSELDVNVMPNPTSNYFNLVVKGNRNAPVTVRVLDVFGQVVEKHEKTSSDKVLRLGHQWTSGIYFAEVIQGDQRKVVKIIKTN